MSGKQEKESNEWPVFVRELVPSPLPSASKPTLSPRGGGLLGRVSAQIAVLRPKSKKIDTPYYRRLFAKNPAFLVNAIVSAHVLLFFVLLRPKDHKYSTTVVWKTTKLATIAYCHVVNTLIALPPLNSSVFGQLSASPTRQAVLLLCRPSCCASTRWTIRRPNNCFRTSCNSTMRVASSLPCGPWPGRLLLAR